jgi:hypothetical protein
MPNLDGTGPQGKGPLTGRRRGRCRDKESEKLKTEPLENNENVLGSGLGRRQHGGGYGGRISGRNQRPRKGYGRK